MTDKDCECGCGCDDKDKKGHLYHLLEPIFSTLPDTLQDMIRGLKKQKVAVFKEIKAWADKNNKKEISELCEKKIEKMESCPIK